ncbi:uncharacterized protein LOC115628755 [Scaptodrosophila lebanonensis]|uniref:Uncharacterized protein LOC115628755 n=1 Tax=Drosophila lebanonensis TaxID=7225 RepID=A0A6J2TWD4_DROLE|nr:uncharacterized protein LOC115628755 [Scaptodrosophila lebanonensis]
MFNRKFGEFSGRGNARYRFLNTSTGYNNNNNNSNNNNNMTTGHVDGNYNMYGGGDGYGPTGPTNNESIYMGEPLIYVPIQFGPPPSAGYPPMQAVQSMQPLQTVQPMQVVPPVQPAQQMHPVQSAGPVQAMQSLQAIPIYVPVMQTVQAAAPSLVAGAGHAPIVPATSHVLVQMPYQRPSTCDVPLQELPSVPIPNYEAKPYTSIPSGSVYEPGIDTGAWRPPQPQVLTPQSAEPQIEEPHNADEQHNNNEQQEPQDAGEAESKNTLEDNTSGINNNDGNDDRTPEPDQLSAHAGYHWSILSNRVHRCGATLELLYTGDTYPRPVAPQTSPVPENEEAVSLHFDQSSTSPHDEQLCKPPDDQSDQLYFFVEDEQPCTSQQAANQRCIASQDEQPCTSWQARQKNGDGTPSPQENQHQDQAHDQASHSEIPLKDDSTRDDQSATLSQASNENQPIDQCDQHPTTTPSVDIPLSTGGDGPNLTALSGRTRAIVHLPPSVLPTATGLPDLPGVIDAFNYFMYPENRAPPKRDQFSTTITMIPKRTEQTPSLQGDDDGNAPQNDGADLTQYDATTTQDYNDGAIEREGDCETEREDGNNENQTTMEPQDDGTVTADDEVRNSETMPQNETTQPDDGNRRGGPANNVAGTLKMEVVPLPSVHCGPIDVGALNLPFQCFSTMSISESLNQPADELTKSFDATISPKYVLDSHIQQRLQAAILQREIPVADALAPIVRDILDEHRRLREAGLEPLAVEEPLPEITMTLTDEPRSTDSVSTSMPQEVSPESPKLSPPASMSWDVNEQQQIPYVEEQPVQTTPQQPMPQPMPQPMLQPILQPMLQPMPQPIPQQRRPQLLLQPLQQPLNQPLLPHQGLCNQHLIQAVPLGTFIPSMPTSFIRPQQNPPMASAIFQNASKNQARKKNKKKSKNPAYNSQAQIPPQAYMEYPDLPLSQPINSNMQQSPASWIMLGQQANNLNNGPAVTSWTQSKNKHNKKKPLAAREESSGPANSNQGNGSVPQAYASYQAPSPSSLTLPSLSPAMQAQSLVEVSQPVAVDPDNNLNDKSTFGWSLPVTNNKRNRRKPQAESKRSDQTGLGKRGNVKEGGPQTSWHQTPQPQLQPQPRWGGGQQRVFNNQVESASNNNQPRLPRWGQQVSSLNKWIQPGKSKFEASSQSIWSRVPVGVPQNNDDISEPPQSYNCNYNQPKQPRWGLQDPNFNKWSQPGKSKFEASPQSIWSGVPVGAPQNNDDISEPIAPQSYHYTNNNNQPKQPRWGQQEPNFNKWSQPGKSKFEASPQSIWSGVPVGAPQNNDDISEPIAPQSYHYTNNNNQPKQPRWGQQDSNFNKWSQPGKSKFETSPQSIWSRVPVGAPRNNDDLSEPTRPQAFNSNHNYSNNNNNNQPKQPRWGQQVSNFNKWSQPGKSKFEASPQSIWSRVPVGAPRNNDDLSEPTRPQAFNNNIKEVSEAPISQTSVAGNRTKRTNNKKNKNNNSNNKNQASQWHKE